MYCKASTGTNSGWNRDVMEENFAFHHAVVGDMPCGGSVRGGGRSQPYDSQPSPNVGKSAGPGAPAGA